MSSYFEVSGSAVCERCKDTAVAAHEKSHAPTLFRAAVLGGLAAAVGAGIYYGIAELTGYEFGLMSIVLGLMVGLAVRVGARGRGGWRYQLLAVFICYASICSTYVPRVIAAIRKEEAKTAGAAPVNTTSVVPTPSADAPPAPTLGSFLKALGLFCAFTLALPFLAGRENAIGIFIIAIGLYEAWKVNRGAGFSVRGPFLAGEGRSG